MKQAFIVLVLLGVAVAPAAAQGRGNGQNRIPPGHLPAAGECRVWYDGVPPGRQPRPTSCAEAERIAARDRNARVVYGSDRDDRYRDDRSGRDNGRWGRNDDWSREDNRRRSGRDERAVPRAGRYPDAYPYPGDRSQRGGSFAFRQGYEDGIVKGREDTRDGDAFDPARHGWYKSANRGYDSRYGSREQYREEYRDGFLDGYRREYRGTGNRSGPSWWPF